MKVYAVPKTQTYSGPKNRIWILDVSGSMTYYLKGMADDLINQLNTCRADDLLTVLWFSSEGMWGTVVKGARIGSDTPLIAQAIKKQLYARNLTCFSDSLGESVRVIGDLSMYNYPVSLMFFSDGYPVVSNYQRELALINKALDALRPKVADATLVGYGDYYNRELLSSMADSLGARLVHAGSLRRFSEVMGQHITQESAARFRLPVEPCDFYFSLDTGAVLTFAAQTDSAGLHLLVPANVERVVGFNKGVWISEGLRLDLAEAYVLTSANEIEAALHILSGVGDVYLCTQLANAFTNEEIGRALDLLHQAIFDTSKRFFAGQHVGCLPARDAFCLLDALDLLESDPDVLVYTDHEDFRYKRTGVASKVTGDYPEFQRTAHVGFSLKLEWHKSRLNVSILVTYSGTVLLGAKAELVGLNPCFIASQFRQYVILKDGVLNVEKLPLSMGRDTFARLQEKGLIDANQHWDSQKVFVVDLTAVPVMNRAMADGLSAKALAEDALADVRLSAQLKVLKYLRNQMDPEKKQVESRYSPDQIAFLSGCGIDAQGRYAPPTSHEEAVDYYEATTVEFKVKGASSLPKVEEVLANVAKGKTPNWGSGIMLNAHYKFKSMTLTDLDWNIRHHQQQQDALRRCMARAKAAIVLGKRWFNDLPRDKSEITVQDQLVTFAIGKQQIPY